jgi:hypothetical protein
MRSGKTIRAEMREIIAESSALPESNPRQVRTPPPPRPFPPPDWGEYSSLGPALQEAVSETTGRVEKGRVGKEDGTLAEALMHLAKACSLLQEVLKRRLQ